MEIKIVYDLDGVLRDLNAYLYDKYCVPDPQAWVWEHRGMNIYDWAKFDELKILTDAPKTKYFDTIMKYSPTPEIWTNQPVGWQGKTLEWIYRYIGEGCKIKFLTGEEKRERLDFLTDTMLVEDSPNFASYKRIILIDQAYNQHNMVYYRVKTPGELNALLEGVLCQTV